MSAYFPPSGEDAAVIRAALRVLAADYGPDPDAHLAAESEYASEQMALAARALVRAVDALPWDEPPQPGPRTPAMREEAEESPAVEAPPLPDRQAQLLECIQAEPGLWTGSRAARAMGDRFGWYPMPDYAVQIMRKLVGRGLLVVANPPRGATFVLPFGPGGQVRHEWSTAVHGQRDPELLDPTSEEMARERMRHPWHTALLRREVTYGPWVEVDASEAGDGVE